MEIYFYGVKASCGVRLIENQCWFFGSLSFYASRVPRCGMHGRALEREIDRNLQD